MEEEQKIAETVEVGHRSRPCAVCKKDYIFPCDGENEVCENRRWALARQEAAKTAR